MKRFVKGPGKTTQPSLVVARAVPGFTVMQKGRTAMRRSGRPLTRSIVAKLIHCLANQHYSTEIPSHVLHCSALKLLLCPSSCTPECATAVWKFLCTGKGVTKTRTFRRNAPTHLPTPVPFYACACADIPGHWRRWMRNDFKPAAFDPHFEDRKSVAFQLVAARRLVRLRSF